MLLNKVKVEGNSIYIRSNPVTGILALTSFVDNASGIDANNTFTKTFSWAKNGIIFSEPVALTVENITAIPVTEKDILVIELSYTKNPVGSSQIDVSSATINVNSVATVDTDLFKNSVFSQFFGSGDVEVLNWMINVLDKLFQRGLLPNYIDRYNDFDSPDDFLEFWGSVCKYFAYYVVYARKFQKFYESEALLSEYLEQRGMRTSPQNDIADLQQLMEKFYREVAKRGTDHVVRKKSDGASIDGEFLRLINFSDDEFLFNTNKAEQAGWNIGNSSPLYRSVTNQDNFNKWYEKDSEPADITKYPTTGTVTIITDNTINKKVFSIATGSGIGTDADFKIAVDEYMDYEFSFFIKKSDGNNLTVGFDAYDAGGNLINLISRSNGTILNNYFFSKNVQRADKYIYCRFFLYNKLKPLFADDGLNLKMVDGIKYVIPKIQIGSGSANVYNVRFLPMALPYSKGFIQVNNFIDCILKNNNHVNRIEDVYQYVKKYLIPYSSHIKIIETNKLGDYSLEVA